MHTKNLSIAKTTTATMSTPNDPAAALADRMRFIIKKDRECYEQLKRVLGDEYPADYLEFEAENKRVLSAYEEAAKAVSPKQAEDELKRLDDKADIILKPLKRFAQVNNGLVANDSGAYVLLEDVQKTIQLTLEGVEYFETETFRLKEELAKQHAPKETAKPELHPKTAELVSSFAEELRAKLRAAEIKYGYTDNWARHDWKEECQRHLLEHLAKGDPRDVAIYCAFLWHHAWPTLPPKLRLSPGWVPSYNDPDNRNCLPEAEPIEEPAKPGDWMREAAADIIELTLDHPPKTSEELVKLLDTGAKVIAELCPAQPKRGDVQILIDALEHIAINEDRENLDGDPAEVALEQCNKMAEDALDEYRKSQPKREISARELIEELEKRHVKTFSNQVLTELEAERARADTGGAT